MTTPVTGSAAAPAPAAKRLNWPFIIVAIVLHVGAFYALIGHWSWEGMAVAFVGQVIFGWIGISMGYHRLLTHASFKVKPWLERVLATLGAMSVQGDPAYWVGTHIQHHAKSDQPGDPHSPRQGGFWWSHMGWMFRGGTREHAFRALERLKTSRYYRFLNVGQILLQIPLAALLYLMGGWTFVLYGIFVRLLISWHVTFCVNSVCHLWGTRRYKTRDDSRNNHLIAWLTGGEGYHNDHHGEQRSARFGRRPWEIDPIWWLILLFEKIGWATDVVRPRTGA